MVTDNINLEALRILSTEISGRSGDSVFAQLVERLAKLLNTDFAFIGRFSEASRNSVTTLALWRDGSIALNATYVLDHSPCKEAASKGYVIYPDRVQDMFPQDQSLVTWGAVAYAAVPLTNSEGITIGILGVLDRKPILEPEKFEQLIKLFAARTSAELERRTIENALQQSQANLTALIESMDEMIWSVDAPDFRILTFNSALRDYLKAVYEIELKPGMTPDDFLPPDIAPLWLEFYRRALNQGSCRIAYQLDSNAGFVELALNAIVRDGKVVGISIIGKDVTLRKRADDELQRSRDDLEDMVRTRTVELEEKNKVLALEVMERKQAEEATKRYEFIANSITDFIGMISRDFTYLAVNDAFCNVFQQGRNEIIGKTVEDIWGDELYDLELKPCLERCFAGENVSLREWQFLGMFGRRYCNVAMYPYRNVNGEISHVITLTRDVTAEFEAERELIEARRVAEEANQAKSLFLANMSHEIRTPMNAIIGMTHLLSQSQLNMKQTDYNSKVEASAQNLLRIINDILDFSKIEAGKIELERVEFCLEDVLADVVRTIAIPAENKKLNIKLSVAPDVPPYLVGDPLRLTQVLLNLAGNGVKFTHQGEIEIAVKLQKLDGAGATVRFEVRDTGIGMTERQIKRLFVPFSQADTTTARQFGGTGLGLAICRSYVEMMGGKLAVESKPGVGTRFCCDLPFKLRQSTRIMSSSSAIMAAVRRVLIIDANQVTRLSLSNVLKQLSFDVIGGSSGADAVFEVARLQKSIAPMFEYIFIDCVQTGLSAMDTARKIREVCTTTSAPPMILVISKETNALLPNAEEAGFTAIVTRPATRATLYNAMMQSRARQNSQRTQDGGAPPADGKLKGARVLLVEDNEINQQIACEIIRIAGCVVTVASGGAEALEILSKSPGGVAFDIVLMDLQMPDMDGYETTRRIRSDARFADLPVIAMTADAVKGVKEKVSDHRHERLSDQAD